MSGIDERLTNPKHWPQELLIYKNEKPLVIAGIAARGSEELFSADLANKVVRKFDVSSDRFNALSNVYQCSNAHSVRSVAYAAHTNTLFICTRRVGPDAKDIVQTVHSFARTDSKFDSRWQECNNLEIHLQGLRRGVLRTLNDWNLIIGDRYRPKCLQMLSVTSSREIHNGVRISLLVKYAEFDARLAEGKVWLAVAQDTKREHEESVKLYSADSNADGTAHQLSTFPLQEPRNPLFCGDNLLVYARNKYNPDEWQVHALSTKGGELKLLRVILSGRDLPGTDYYCPEWCVANDALIAWNLDHKRLTIYSGLSNLLIGQ